MKYKVKYLQDKKYASVKKVWICIDFHKSIILQFSS